METHQIKLRNIIFYWSDENQRYELVQHNHFDDADYYPLLALYEKNDFGYEMKIIQPSLFFANKDAWTVGKLAISFLNDMFTKEKEA